MVLTTVGEIEQAIGTLTPQEWRELYTWLDSYEHPLDARMKSDLALGRLDEAVRQALDDEQNSRVLPL